LDLRSQDKMSECKLFGGKQNLQLFQKDKKKKKKKKKINEVPSRKMHWSCTSFST